MDAYNKAAGVPSSRGNAPAQTNWVGDAHMGNPTGGNLLAHRIGYIRKQRAHGAAALAAAAGAVIDRSPHCPRRASQLVDRLTLAWDLAVREGRE